MAMKKGLKARWVAALRSGKYKQCKDGRLELLEEEGVVSYCCLGVLREISPAVKRRHAGQSLNYLSGTALAYARLTDEQQVTLSEMNDDVARNNFKRIATYIEKNL
jgi:hypothetical protein